MRHGHYTLSDISGLTIVPRNKKKNIARHAYGTMPDGAIIKSNSLDFEIWLKGNNKIYSHLEQVPVLYRNVAKIIGQKATGHGGYRSGAGRKTSDMHVEKKEPRTFRLTEQEYLQVKEYIKQLRNEI